ncbi:MAG TPA: hypothetical protein VMW94_04395, partial [Actinomycetes bacterium]|nr:hypothetical protein [Actinomycetes bacterium]
DSLALAVAAGLVAGPSEAAARARARAAPLVRKHSEPSATAPMVSLVGSEEVPLQLAAEAEAAAEARVAECSTSRSPAM